MPYQYFVPPVMFTIFNILILFVSMLTFDYQHLTKITAETDLNVITLAVSAGGHLISPCSLVWNQSANFMGRILGKLLFNSHLFGGRVSNMYQDN